MTKATLSLPSPNPRGSRQKKKPCPPGDSPGFQARISPEFTGGAAPRGKRRSPGTRFHQQKKPKTKPKPHHHHHQNTKETLPNPNRNPRRAAAVASPTPGGRGMAPGGTRPGLGQLPGGKAPLKIKPGVGKRGTGVRAPAL